jgi:hypothetical protein
LPGDRGGADTKPSDKSDLTGYLAGACITGQLDTSKAVLSSIRATTREGGRRTITDGDLTYECSYHPDNGWYLLITDAECARPASFTGIN